MMCFNPRSHVGSDGATACIWSCGFVSIHAPTWGATGYRQYSIDVALFQSTLPRGERHRGGVRNRGGVRFQSTLPRGERPRQFSFCDPDSGFQSTLPRGERLTFVPALMRSKCFNPRSHVGSDIFCKHIRESADVSIHAPTWGATRRNTLTTSSKRFQSTLPRGERLLDAVYRTVLRKFQSTLPHGERLVLIV